MDNVKKSAEMINELNIGMMVAIDIVFGIFPSVKDAPHIEFRGFINCVSLKDVEVDGFSLKYLNKIDNIAYI